MFDFWKEVVINSATVDGKQRIQNVDGFLRVLRCADYHKDGIVGGVIYRTKPEEAKLGQVAVTGSDAASGHVLQLVLKIALVGKTDGEYALPWTSGKPVILEGTTVNAILAKAAKIEGLTVSDSNIVCADGHMVIAKAVLNDIDLATGDVVEKDLLVGENASKTAELRKAAAGRPAIGTGKWVIENLRFPTTANRSYTAVHADELPNADGEYVQYAFEYRAPNRGLHGQGTVGQELVSVTHHVFYVEKSVDDDITGLGGDGAKTLTALIQDASNKLATVKDVDYGTEVPDTSEIIEEATAEVGPAVLQ